MSEDKPGDENGTQFNPQTGFPVPSSYQPEQPQEPPQPPYGQAPYGQAPYGQPQYPQYQQYQQPYPPQPGQPQMYYGYVQPEHPQANTALIVGLVSVFGGFTCGLPLLAAPWAWVAGYKARKEIAASPGRYGGEGKATAGMVLGIIGTALIAIILLAIVVVVIVGVSGGFDSTGTDTGIGT